MYCNELNLKDFRNYRELDLRLHSGLSVFQGENAAGKTSLLEAIYLLATTKSSRAGTEQELVNLEAQPEPELGAPAFARISVEVVRQEGDLEAEIVVIRDGGNPETNTGPARKRIKVNGVARRAVDLIGRINVVLFSPEDLDLVIGSPSGRRRYLDITLSQIDHKYLRMLSEYQKIVAQRNGYLHTLREGQRNGSFRNQVREREELALWNAELVRCGAYITMRRRDCLQSLNKRAGRLHRNLIGYFTALLGNDEEISGGFELRYLPSFAIEPNDDEATICRKFSETLNEMRSKEIARGVSLVGPHRDDFMFRVDGSDVAVYGSRGQQRTAVLSLKLAEVGWMEEQTGDRPILLLDDILSELDVQRRQYVLETVQNGAEQVLITTTDLSLFNDIEYLHKQAAVYHVGGGKVTPVTPPQ